jgi:uncharacterized protein (TIGR02466 family)
LYLVFEAKNDNLYFFAAQAALVAFLPFLLQIKLMTALGVLQRLLKLSSLVVFVSARSSAITLLKDVRSVLSKCNCIDRKADCDFSSLSKDALINLIGALDIVSIDCTSNTPELVMSDGSKPVAEKSYLSIEENFDCKLSDETGDGTTCFSGHGYSYFFPSVILSHGLPAEPLSRQYNDDLLHIALQLEKDQKESVRDETIGFVSSRILFDIKHPAVDWLRAHISSRVNLLLSQTNSTETLFEIEGWANVMRSGESMNIHVHTEGIFAGAYFVAAPKEVGAPGESGGCLQFIDPRGGAEMAQILRGRNVYGDAMEVCPPSQGLFLAIFPGWLMHEVRRMKPHFRGPRVSIGFTVKYVYR